MADANLSDIYRKAMTVLTGGPFDGRITEAQAGKSSNDNDQIVFTVQIEGGPNHGHTTRDQATLSDAAATMFFEKMAMLGFDGEFFAPKNPPAGWTPPSLEDVAREMVGRPCRFELIEDPWAAERGRKKSKISKILPPGDGAKRVVPAASNGTPGVPGTPSVANVPGTPVAAPPVPVTTPATAPPDLKLPDGTEPPF